MEQLKQTISTTSDWLTLIHVHNTNIVLIVHIARILYHKTNNYSFVTVCGFFEWYGVKVATLVSRALP
jgi:hypothetical protein